MGDFEANAANSARVPGIFRRLWLREQGDAVHFGQGLPVVGGERTNRRCFRHFSSVGTGFVVVVSSDGTPEGIPFRFFADGGRKRGVILPGRRWSPSAEGARNFYGAVPRLLGP